MKKLATILILTLAFSSCTKEDLFDIFIGGQPKFFEEDNYDKQLNVFTILQPDGYGGFDRSVFELSRTRMALNDTLNDSILLMGTSISLLKLSNEEVIDSIRFTYYWPDSIAFDPESDSDFSFRMEEDHSYHLEIYCESFTPISADCTLPPKPILSSEVEREGEAVIFRLQNDPSIFLYEVFFVYEDFLSNPYRIQPQNKQDVTAVELVDEYPERNLLQLRIYSYDINLSTYYSFSNVFIKPNTYRPPFTTVEGGYGCFGAINELVLEL